MNLCIFEDTSFSNFLPLVYFRPVYHLRCGITTLEAKIRSFFSGSRIVLHCRPYLAEYLRESDPSTPVNKFADDDIWLINGRVIADEAFAQAIRRQKKEDAAFFHGDELAAVYLTQKTFAPLRPHLAEGFP